MQPQHFSCAIVPLVAQTTLATQEQGFRPFSRECTVEDGSNTVLAGGGQLQQVGGKVVGMNPTDRRARDSTDQSVGRRWLDLSDDELLAQCAVDTYRARGPGGQKRNKTSSAVRLRHQPTGLIVTAAESRSQHENRARALRRLRLAIALHIRGLTDNSGEVPECFFRALQRDAGLRVNRRHPDYYRTVQHVLDVFAACEARLSDTAGMLGISTGHLVRFLSNDPKVWEEANRMRASFGRQPLR